MKHAVDAHVGWKVRKRRWMMGMTQKQLGDSVGVKVTQIQKYETGLGDVIRREDIRFDTVLALAINI